MLKSRGMFPIILLFFILLLNEAAYACYKIVVDLSPHDKILIIFYLCILFAASASDYTKIPVEIFILLLSSILAIGIFGTPVTFLILSIVFVAFIIRVCKIAKADKRNYFLLILLLPLFYCMYLTADSTFTVNCYSICHQKLNHISDALESYRHDQGCYPQKLGDLVPFHRGNIPRCEPIIGSGGAPFKGEIKEKGKFKPADYSYDVNEKLDNYTIRCQSRNHEPWDIPKGYPLYNPINGLKDRPGE